ncbi:MAG TPA: alpha/beta fold hydrolase, partial [candidate division Zixibacteria bacterium]|nr:alpha/beta fold hydrolase [candidate division Zixibacteria bacterium]
MATYVLVHGGWDGGWAWRGIARRLQAAGHEVFTPTLTGSGERAHLASPDVDLSTQIMDVVNVLRYEKLEEVILVANSYGGMVITGVAEKLPSRIKQMIYLDAFVPVDGESLADLAGPDVMGYMEQAAAAFG